MSKFFCNGADAECNCPILCSDCASADWTGGTEIKTNADHIRSMTDEELAKFINRKQATCPYCELIDTDGACTETLCDNAMLRWLRQPYKEET